MIARRLITRYRLPLARMISAKCAVVPALSPPVSTFHTLGTSKRHRLNDVA